MEDKTPQINDKSALLNAGLHIKLERGWKTYWREPGAAGYPPRIDWSGSQNIRDVTILWPTPQKFEVLGYETYGYSDEVVYPLLITLIDPAKPVKLRANVDYLVCDVLCIPYSADLSLILTQPSLSDPADADLIQQYKNQIPRSHSDLQSDGFAHIEGSRLTYDGAKYILETDIKARAENFQGFTSPFLIIENAPGFTFTQAKTTSYGKDHLVIAQAVSFDEKNDISSLLGKTLLLTFIDEGKGVEGDLIINSAISAYSMPAPLWVILAIALLGGLILNVMPCVLPVLSLKVFGLIDKSGEERRSQRLSFLSTALGGLLTFTGLAAVLILLQASGKQVGWGVQFQNPWFLGIMTAGMVIFAFNLWGLFPIHLPQFAAQSLARLQFSGQFDSFAQGVVAALLATPCSAPFVGTAVGFALSQSPAAIFLIFTALGLGFVAPYLLIAAFPRLVGFLPKPGRWMPVLRQVLGLGLAGTALWLAWILTKSLGILPVAGLIFVVSVILLGNAFKKGTLRLTARDAQIAGAPALFLIMSLILFTGLSLSNQEHDNKASPSTQWATFDEGAILNAVDRGGIVFVDVTADWCLTCQVNEALVLKTGEIVSLFAQDGILAMRADWTEKDPVIARYLAKYKRYGIPFNIVYGPNARTGILLPEWLQKKDVIEAIEKAQKKPEQKGLAQK